MLQTGGTYVDIVKICVWFLTVAYHSPFANQSMTCLSSNSGLSKGSNCSVGIISDGLVLTCRGPDAETVGEGGGPIAAHVKGCTPGRGKFSVVGG